MSELYSWYDKYNKLVEEIDATDKEYAKKNMKDPK